MPSIGQQSNYKSKNVSGSPSRTLTMKNSVFVATTISGNTVYADSITANSCQLFNHASTSNMTIRPINYQHANTLQSLQAKVESQLSPENLEEVLGADEGVNGKELMCRLSKCDIESDKIPCCSYRPQTMHHAKQNLSPGNIVDLQQIKSKIKPQDDFLNIGCSETTRIKGLKYRSQFITTRLNPFSQKLKNNEACKISRQRKKEEQVEREELMRKLSDENGDLRLKIVTMEIEAKKTRERILQGLNCD